MSHVASCELEGRDLKALISEVTALGGTFISDRPTFEWYGKFLNDWQSNRAAVNKGIDPETFGKCTHVIRPPGWKKGDYEVGVVVRDDGTFYLLYDAWSGGGQKIEAAFGADCTKIKMNYGATLAAKQLAKQGYKVTRKVDQHGRPLIKAHKT